MNPLGLSISVEIMSIKKKKKKNKIFVYAISLYSWYYLTCKCVCSNYIIENHYYFVYVYMISRPFYWDWSVAKLYLVIINVLYKFVIYKIII